jgi:hypothetical protein
VATSLSCPNRSNAVAARWQTATARLLLCFMVQYLVTAGWRLSKFTPTICGCAGVCVRRLGAAGGAAAAVCAVRGGAAGAVGRHPHPREHHRCAPPCGGRAVGAAKVRVLLRMMLLSELLSCSFELHGALRCHSQLRYRLGFRPSTSDFSLVSLTADTAKADSRLRFTPLSCAGALRRGLRAEDLIGYMRERAHPRVAARTPIVPEVPEFNINVGQHTGATAFLARPGSPNRSWQKQNPQLAHTALISARRTRSKLRHCVVSPIRAGGVGPSVAVEIGGFLARCASPGTGASQCHPRRWCRPRRGCDRRTHSRCRTPENSLNPKSLPPAGGVGPGAAVAGGHAAGARGARGAVFRLRESRAVGRHQRKGEAAGLAPVGRGAARRRWVTIPAAAGLPYPVSLINTLDAAASHGLRSLDGSSAAPAAATCTYQAQQHRLQRRFSGSKRLGTQYSGHCTPLQWQM